MFRELMTEDASTAAKIEQLLLPAGVREFDRTEVEASQRRRLQLALALLAHERGYELVSIDEIAECAKLSKSTLYEHFGGREELLRSAVEDFRQEARERIRRGLAGYAAGDGEAAWPEAVQVAVEGLCETVEAEPELARLTFVEGTAVPIEDPDHDPSELILGEMLNGAASAVPSPAQLDGVQWRALNGAFKSALQDQLRRGDVVGVEPTLKHSLSYLIVVAHLGEDGVQEMPA